LAKFILANFIPNSNPSMPSTSGLLAGATSQDTSTSLVVATSKQPATPQDILSSPKVAPCKDGAPKRKRVKTAILTDTPEKERIEQKRADNLNKKETT